MDRVICVSEAQAKKVRRAGVQPDRIRVICNAVRPERFERPDPAYRERLRRMFTAPPRKIVGAAGRFSPEKGFGVLVDAAAEVLNTEPQLGFVVFGDGPLRASLARQIEALGIQERFVLTGFRPDFDKFLPHLDLMVLPSFSEGLPNVVLEALAASVPVVATAVGGTPEVIEDGKTGYLSPPGDARRLASQIVDALCDDAARQKLSAQGRARVEERFSFVAQSQLYQRLLGSLVGGSHASCLTRPQFFC
jgi:glycosyltransferase involved in cell wall biosynthesis